MYECKDVTLPDLVTCWNKFVVIESDDSTLYLKYQSNIFQSRLG